MMELEKCKEELKNTINELSHWQSGGVKSIEVYNVDKEVSTYVIAGPSTRREACYLWEDIEISNIEEGRALNSWLIGLFLMLEVILFYKLNFTSKEQFARHTTGSFLDSSQKEDESYHRFIRKIPWIHSHESFHSLGSFARFHTICMIRICTYQFNLLR